MPNNKMERFTRRARQVLTLAQDYAERLHHNAIDSQHLLMALFIEDEGIAARVLHDLGVELAPLQAAIERISPINPPSDKADADLSQGSKRVLELAVDEARKLGHHYIGTEHLLLGLVRVEDGAGVQVLKHLNINPEDVRRQTQRVMQERTEKKNNAPLKGFETLPIPSGFFTDRAVHVITAAQEIAVEFGHPLIGTEHLLLGILRESHGVGARVLRDLAVMPARVEKLIVELGSVKVTPQPTTLAYAPSFKRVLEFAADESRRLQNTSHLRNHLVGTEHLLLGLVRHTDGIAIDILKRVGVDPDEVWRQTRRVMGEKASLRPHIPPPKPPLAGADSDYTLLQATIFKLLEMVAAKTLTLSQVAELFSALAPGLKVSIMEQADLISQLFQMEKLQHYQVRLRVTDSSGAETPGETMLPLTRLLTEVDTFLDRVINQPETPLVYTQDGFTLEVRIEKGEPDV